MILHQFPDLQWLRSQAEQQFANRKAWDGSLLPTSGWPTVILNAKSQDIYRDNIPGPLSLFMNLSGSSYVTTGNRRQRVNEGFFYLTNDGERYTLEIEKEPAETFNIHFGQYLAEQLLSSLTSSDDLLLNGNTNASPVEFTSRLLPVNGNLYYLVENIRVSTPTKLQFEECIAEILSELLREETSHRRKQNNLDALKSTTRSEVAKRLEAAVDYIYSNYNKNIGLDELSRASALSKFHLLRQFRLFHKKTPYQFLNDVRIDRARKMLTKGSAEIKTIAALTGFKDASSFSRLFVKKTGLYPSEFRSAGKQTI